jgi:hypothetical protein
MFVEERLKSRFDFAEFEIVETDYAVYAIIKIRDLVVIAVRGTVPLYFFDWRIDLSTRKEYFSFGSARGFLHQGFYNETLASAPRLAEVLTRFGAFKSNGADMKVYVTGHSLGGAIAALLHGLWIRDQGTRMVTPAASSLNGANRYVTHSAYTFGMPRIADAEVARRLRGVYRVRNQYDPVPSLPPSLMGFVSDQSHEEILHPVKMNETDPVKAFATLLWIHSLGRARMLKNHAMENYWKDLARTISIEIPLGLLPPDPKLFSQIKF